VKRILLSTLTLSLAAAFANAADNAPAKPAGAPVSGIDTQFIDTSVRPQDDFFTYLNGKWLKETEIPGDKASWGTFMKLRDDVTPQIKAIIEAAQADKSAKTG
jgi:predicted metalloendopeptidase